MSDPPANRNVGLDILAAAAEILSGPSAVQDAPGAQLQPAAKRRHGNAAGGAPKKRQKRKGKLASLLSIMPTELFYKIFGYLRPEDLLRLVRAAKMFASVLLGTSASASSIWRTARLQHDPDIPDKPYDLTEQKYAVLLFGSFCNRCGQRSVRHVSWRLRRKLCLACRTAIVSGEDPHYGMAQEADQHRDFFVRVLYHGELTDHSSRPHTVYLVDHWRTLSESRNAVKADPVALDNFDKEHEVNKNAVLAHAGACEKWQTRKASARNKELESVRKEREETLKIKLLESGSEPLLVHGFPWHDFKTMGQSRPLTDYAWKQLKPEAEAALEGFRTKMRSQLYCRFSNSFRTAYKKWSEVAIIMTDDIYPSYKWAETLPPIKESLNHLVDADPLLLLRDPDVVINIPSEETDKIPGAIIAWRHDLEQHFLSLLPSLDDSVPTRSAFSLAISIYRCKKDNTSAYFPDLWYHVRGNPAHGLFHYPGDAENGPVWPSPDYWTFDEDSSSVIRSIILAYGVDPNWTTHETLDSARTRLVCLECSASKCDGMYGPVMTWRRAVDHWRTEHTATPGHKSRWRQLSWEELVTFHKTKEVPYLESPNAAGSFMTERWICKACFDFGWEPRLYSRETLRQHFAKEHYEGKVEQVRNIIGCFADDPAAPLIDPPPIFWNPNVEEILETN